MEGVRKWNIHVKIAVLWLLNRDICATLVAIKPSVVFAVNRKWIPSTFARINLPS
jgi:hypothetical protein